MAMCLYICDEGEREGETRPAGRHNERHVKGFLSLPLARRSLKTNERGTRRGGINEIYYIEESREEGVWGTKGSRLLCNIGKSMADGLFFERFRAFCFVCFDRD